MHLKKPFDLRCRPTNKAANQLKQIIRNDPNDMSSKMPRKTMLFYSCLFLSLLAFNARGQTVSDQWWDNNGTSTATSGTWDTTTKNWTSSTNLTASTVAFTNDNFPEFAAGTAPISALTITVNSAVNCAGMAAGLTGSTVTNLTFSGTGSIGIVTNGGASLNGFLVQGIYCDGASGGNFLFNVPLTGAAGIVQHGNGYIALAGTNTYAGGTGLTGGQIIYYYNSNSFGAGPINVGGTGNALVNNTSPAAALTIPNNFVFPTAGYSINLAGGNPVSSAPGTTFTGAFPLPSGTTTINTSSTATEVIEITGVISGSGAALTVADDGTLELGGFNTYSGATTVSSPATLSIVGTGDLGDNGSGSGLYAGLITNSGTFIYASSASQTLSGIIYGTGPLTQNGSGKLVLSAANAYAGGTTINGGLLDVGTGVQNSSSGSIAGTVTLTAGTLELDSATALSPFAILNLPSAPSAGAVNLNFTGTQTIVALNLGLTSMAPGTYGAMGNAGVMYQNAAFTGPGILSVTISSADNSYWDANGTYAAGTSTGGGSGNWDNSTSDWWVSGSSDTTWPSGTIANFAGTAGTVTVAAGVTADALNFTTSGYTVNGSSTLTLASPTSTITIPAGTTTIGSPIAGGGALTNLTVSGPGTLVLSGANTFTGTNVLTNGITLSAGAIADSGTSGLGFATNMFFGGGSTLTYTGTGSNYTARLIKANGAATSTINVASGILTLAGAVTSGTGSTGEIYTKTGPGTLYLAGVSNDNSGVTMAINQGTVVISKVSYASAHGLGSGASTIASGAELQLAGPGSYDLYSGCILTVASGGLFDVNGQNDSFSTLTLTGSGFGSGVLINSASGTTSLITNAGSAVVLAGPTLIGGAGSITLASVVSGDFPLTYGGGGTLGLSGANTFNGGLYINPNCTVQINAAAGGGVGPTVLGSSSTLGVNIAAGNLVNPIVGPASSIVNIIETAADNLEISSDMSGFTGTMTCPPTAGTTAKAEILSPVFSINPSATINVKAGGTLYLANPGIVIPCLLNLYGTGNTEVYGALRMEAGALVTGPVHLLGNTTIGNGQSGAAKAATISGVISGSFGIAYTAEPGTMDISGSNTYTGTTTFSNTSVVLLDSPELGTSGPLGEPAAGPNSLIFRGGTLQFTNVNTYDYSSRFSNSSSAYVFDENGQTVTFASPITGTATLTNVSSVIGGVLILSAANTYNGLTALNSGTLRLASSDTPGTSGPLGASTAVASIILSGGILQYTAANGGHDYSGRFSTNTGQDYNIDVNGQSVTYATALTSGTGEITLYSTIPGGTLSLGGTNAFTGATTINPGATLTISGAGCLGATNTYTNYAGAITDHGALNYASSANQILSGVIFGSGSLTQSGTGTLTLSNANTYYGGTTVSAGTLQITNTGSILGNVTVSGGVLKLDNATALLPSATLTLASSPAAGAVNLNFSGVQNISALTFGSTPMPPGTYGALGNGSVTYQNAAFIGSGILNVQSEGAYWDPSGSDAAPGSGGSGSWDSSTSDWFNGSGDALWTAGNIATFAYAPGTVTLNANETADGLAFAAPAYVINGGSTLTLSGVAGNSTPTITIPAGNTTIACPVASGVASNSVIISGPGTLALTGANTFTNPVVVSGGATLSFNSLEDSGTSALGPLGVFGNNSTNILTLINGNLSFTGSSGDTARNVQLQGTVSDVINVPVGDTLEFDGRVYVNTDTAPFALTFTGGGTLIFGPSPFGGAEDNGALGMIITAGTVIINKNSSSVAHGLGGEPTLIYSNATLQLSGSGGYDLYSGCIILVSNGGVLDLGGQSDAFSTLYLEGSGINGSGALMNSGGSPSLISPSVILAANTTIAGSTSSGNITLTGVISGYGYALTYAGSSGTLYLSGANTYSGGLNLAPNTTVELESTTGAGAGPINIGLGATLIISNGFGAGTPLNAIIGTNSGPNNPTSTIEVATSTTGNTYLSAGLNNFSGTINCANIGSGTGGQVVINQVNNEAYPPNAAAIWVIQNLVTVDMATPFTNDPASVQINGTGANNSYGALRLDACNQQGNVLLNSGYGTTCLIGSGNTTGPSTISGIISDGGNNVGFNWVTGVAAPGPALILNAVNTYGGPTVVSNSGTLAMGPAGSIASSSGVLLASGTVFDLTRVSGSYGMTANQTLANYNGSATINGNLTLSSGATLNLTNNVSGAPLIVTNGTLTLNNNPVNLSIANSISPGASGYLLIQGTSGGAVAGAVASSTVTLNGFPAPAGAYLSIINGSLYLVAGPPVIFAGPNPPNPIIFANNATYTNTNSITFSVLVFGAPTLTNQWYTNGTPVPGATNASVTLRNVPVGTYTVTFGSTNSYNPGGAAVSTTLQVVAAPTTSFASNVLALNPVGYWRLNEAGSGAPDNGPNNGAICHEYIQGYDGAYTNAALDNAGYDSFDSSLPGDPNYDPETSAYFGQYASPNSCAFAIATNVDVSAATNKSATFTVQAWVQCPGVISDSINTPTIAAKGYYYNEEFTIDCGTHIGSLCAYRFTVRNAGGALYGVGSTLIAGADTNWHFLAGVCDEVHSNVAFYIDGTNVGASSIPAGSGIVASNVFVPMTIGARSSSATAGYDQQFSGYINDVALFTNAFTSNQVQNEYFQAGIPPTVELASNSIAVNEFGTAVMPSYPYGSPSLAVQWYVQINGGAFTAIAGQTNAILTLSNVQSSYNNVLVVVTNAYGAVTSSPVFLNVNSGPAYIAVDTTPPIIQVPPGTILTYSVVAAGADPIYYEWLLNGATAIPGATNYTYTFAAQFGTNTYTCGVSNSQNGSWSLGHAVTVIADSTPPVIELTNNGLWSLQNTGAFTPTISASGVLEITSAAGDEACSAFYEIPQYISNGFVVSYIYTPSGGSSTRADGTAFVLQNAGNTYTALGADGGNLGYSGIAPSVALITDLFTGGVAGLNWETNGLTAAAGGLPNGATGSVNINSLDPISVTITYASSSNNVQVVLKDTTTLATYATNYTTGNLATMLGGITAFIGFTGGTGGDDTEQQISDFSFVYTAPNEGPVILDNISPTNMDAPVGAEITYSVGAIGTQPLYYTWYENGVVIAGANGSSYTFAATAGSNNFQCGVSNAVGGSTNVYSSVASVVAAVTPPVVGLGNSSLWQLQGSGFTPTISGTGALETTSSAGSEGTSAYYTIPQYINNGFVASFIYTPSAGSSTRADGTAFVLQNSLNGPFSLGLGGGGLGITYTVPNVEFCLDLYSGAAGGTGINWTTNGETAEEGGLANGGTSPVNINSLDPIAVTITYHPELGAVKVTLQDTVSSAAYATNYTVGNNLAAAAGGDTAYIGFGAGTGSDYAEQTISNFSFNYVGPAAAIIQDLTPLLYSNYVGSNITYTVVASGDQPISYAWFVNSNLVAGATSPSYTLTIPAAGSNTVQCGVSNSYNSSYALSSVAVAIGLVPPAPAISIQLVSTNVVITWSAGASLFSATNLLGPWTMVTNATSPYTNAASASEQFYQAATPY
jgi:autotransporter-associated beta strand protein